jgi:transposase
MSVKGICDAFRVGKSSVYRFKQRERETGTIEPTNSNCGRKSEVCAKKMKEFDVLIFGNSDITLTEVKEQMHLSIQKSQISNIIRKKLGYRYKKMVYASERDRADVKVKRVIWNTMRSTIDAITLVFLDVSSVNINTTRRYGRCPSEYAKGNDPFIICESRRDNDT